MRACVSEQFGELAQNKRHRRSAATTSTNVERLWLILQRMLSWPLTGWTGLLGLQFECDVRLARAMMCQLATSLACRLGMAATQTDMDMYDFKLKCSGRWGPWSGGRFPASRRRKR